MKTVPHKKLQMADGRSQVEMKSSECRVQNGPTREMQSEECKVQSSSERLLTKEEVAVRCQVTTRCVEKWMARGVLRFAKMGRSVRFRSCDVEEHVTAFYKGLRG